MATHFEVESKFDVGPEFALPDLLTLPGVKTLEQPEVQHLEAVYIDTADLSLLRSRTTLRRRTGGEDAGWHLKLPTVGTARLEVHRPLGRSVRSVPAPLARLVHVRVRGRELMPVARLETHRRVSRLLDADGAVLAEVADDLVNAQALPVETGGAVTTTSWREIEVELVGGNEELLAWAAQALGAVGAQPATTGSKVARALAGRLQEGTPAPAASAQEAGKQKGAKRAKKLAKKAAPVAKSSATAGEVVQEHLRQLVHELLAWDPHVRASTDDAVHKMRVSTRRLRSSLATFRPVIARESTDAVRDELRWLGAILGAARDAEVLQARLREAVATLPAELVVGPVSRRIDVELRATAKTARTEVLSTLDGERYLALVVALEGLVADPPFTEAAGEPAKKALRKCVRRTWRRVDGLVVALDDESGADAAVLPERRDHLLHEVRKRAKRARYAGESVMGVFEGRAQAYAAAMEEVQEVLGDHQDSVATRALLRDMGMRASLAGENGFTFGLLHGLEHGRARAAEESFAEIWKAARSAARKWPG